MKTEKNPVHKTIYNSQLYNQKALILHKIRELTRKLATHKKQNSQQIHTQKKKKKKRNPENVVYTVYTIKRNKARDLAVWSSIASMTEQRKPSETTAFEQTLSISISPSTSRDKTLNVTRQGTLHISEDFSSFFVCFYSEGFKGFALPHWFGWVSTI